ncbi:MAG: glycosidase [Verrucomicrobia bacterium]|nr:glycosidase [Verrucomicrobiota bacterium]MCH8526058.1 glycosidase [Kiritimatiellia bacterium]
MTSLFPSFDYDQRLKELSESHRQAVETPNPGIWHPTNWYRKHPHPVVTPAHVPLQWRYDLNRDRNPLLIENLPIQATFNAGAIELDGRIAQMVRIEGHDRKSFFGLCWSDTGVDGFTFTGHAIVMPETDDPDTNVYDMRLVKHEDGWIYGLFCTERKDPNAAPGDLSSAVAQCGIARSKNLIDWERLPDLKSPSAQQRNVVLHPEFVNGKYAFYTRPQDGFIDAGSGGGIGWALCGDITRPVVTEERIIESRLYHTVKEVKNGQGPAPIKSPIGWIHLAHGVRGTATGLRYVLYVFVTDLEDPARVTHSPGGAFIVPEGDEQLGDLSHIVFSNGWVCKDDGTVFIYYASCDTRMHVATTTLDRLIAYCEQVPRDPLRSRACVAQRNALIDKNRE